MASSRWVLMVVLCLLLCACGGDAREAYYRGVYEACVRERAVDGMVTQFDLRACELLESTAREDGWFEMYIQKP